MCCLYNLHLCVVCNLHLWACCALLVLGPLLHALLTPLPTYHLLYTQGYAAYTFTIISISSFGPQFFLGNPLSNLVTSNSQLTNQLTYYLSCLLTN